MIVCGFSLIVLILFLKVFRNLKRTLQTTRSSCMTCLSTWKILGDTVKQMKSDYMNWDPEELPVETEEEKLQRELDAALMQEVSLSVPRVDAKDDPVLCPQFPCLYLCLLQLGINQAPQACQRIRINK